LKDKSGFYGDLSLIEVNLYIGCPLISFMFVMFVIFI
jgi:hypothetical protein